MLPPALTFDALRQAGIAHAQEASSDLWTDYNLHDPGVTLLEQTCFALTELAYRSDMALRDLLTGPDGVLDFERLALFAPGDVLRSAPVTHADLETCLGSLPQAARVRLVGNGRRGLMRARVIPQAGFSESDAVAAVTAYFAAHRPLCTDLEGVEAARPVPARLRGRLVVGRRALPERVAAEVWLRVSLVLRGTPLAERPDAGTRGATRADVARDPMLHEGLAPLHGAAGRSAHVAALRLVPALEEIRALDLTTDQGAALPDFQPPDADSYLALLPPDPDARDGLTVVQDGVQVRLDLTRLTQEIDRLRAEFLAAEANRLDPADWAVPRSGTPRSFDHVSVNATLPAIYAFRPQSAEARQLAGYRSLIDTCLGAMTTDLDHAPQLFSADATQRASHWSYLPQLAQGAGLIAGSGDWAATFALHDNWHERRAQVLDLLIALQGEAMPTEGRSELDRDRPAPQHSEAALNRRARFLHALPDINRRRGSGPDGADPGGVLLKFLCLADLPVRMPGDILAAQAAAGFDILPDTADMADTSDAANVAVMAPGDVPRDVIELPDDPLDLLVPDRAALPIDPAAMSDALPWLTTGGLSVQAFGRAPLAESWLVAPEGSAGWRVLFDAGAGDLYDAGGVPHRAAAVERANGLRAGFAALGRASEGAWLIEDIRLRGDTLQVAAQTATLVLPGWSPRTAAPAYRRHAARLIDRVAPAHCRIRPLWLGPAAFARFAAAWDAWQADAAAGPALAALLAAGARAP